MAVAAVHLAGPEISRRTYTRNNVGVSANWALLAAAPPLRMQAGSSGQPIRIVRGVRRAGARSLCAATAQLLLRSRQPGDARTARSRRRRARFRSSAAAAVTLGTALRVLAFQEAPRTFLQLWGHGRRFWGIAARSGLGQEASASGDNGNLRGQKRN